MKLVSALALTTLSLVGVACGSDSSPRGADVPPTPSAPSAPSTTEPPGTPPATDPPGTPPATDPPVDDPGLPARPVEVDDGAFDSIGDLGAGADLIVVGTVSDEVSLGRPQATTDPSADEFLGLTITVETVLKGEPVTEVALAWEAYAVDADGTRVASNVTNGIPVPHVGDQLVLFLRPVDDQFAEFVGGFPTHALVALDGIGFLDAGVVSISDDTAQGAAHLTGMTVEQITALL